MQILKKSFVVFIAMLLLISCSGVFVMIHTCMGSGKTEISFSDEHKCCSKKKKSQNNCRIERRCCTVDYQYHKLSVVSLPVEKSDVFDFILSEITAFVFKPNLVERSFRSVHHSPPLLVHDHTVNFRQLLI